MNEAQLAKVVRGNPDLAELNPAQSIPGKQYPLVPQTHALKLDARFRSYTEAESLAYLQSTPHYISLLY